MFATKHKQADQQRKRLAVNLGRVQRLCWESGSGDTWSMCQLGLLKGRALIGLVGLPDGVENARPDIGQSSDGDRMALAFGSLALIIRFGPGFLLRTLPGKLMQGIAPGLDTAQPTVSFLIRPALEEDRGGASQGLQTAGALIAAAILAQFRQQSRSETGSGSGQSLEELAVGMTQKKAGDLLVVVGNLLEQRFQLGHQSQHQPRFGAGRDLIGVQRRLLKLLDDLLRFLTGPRISGLLEQSR